jgi:hypothetical protein
MALQTGKLQSRAKVQSRKADEDDGASAKRIKLMVVGGLVGLLLLVIVAGSLMSGSGGGATPATNTGTAPPVAQTPAESSKPPEGEARLVVSILANDPSGNRLTFGPKLPFAIPSMGTVDIDGGRVAGGQHRWDRTDPQNGAGVQMLIEPDTAATWVRVEIDAPTRRSLLGRTVDMAERLVPPMLMADAEQIGAAGFVYEDSSERAFALETVVGLRGLEQAPKLSATRNDQKMWLLFRVTKGAQIRSLHYGRRKILEWEQPVLVPN